MHSNFITGEMAVRDIRNIATGRAVPASYNGKPLSFWATGGARFRVSERKIREEGVLAMKGVLRGLKSNRKV
jgi:hypothetical protein